MIEPRQDAEREGLLKATEQDVVAEVRPGTPLAALGSPLPRGAPPLMSRQQQADCGSAEGSGRGAARTIPGPGTGHDGLRSQHKGHQGAMGWRVCWELVLGACAGSLCWFWENVLVFVCFFVFCSSARLGEMGPELVSRLKEKQKLAKSLMICRLLCSSGLPGPTFGFGRKWSGFVFFCYASAHLGEIGPELVS